MYVAELQGKVSSRLQRSEDLLTSNVFSFFKYADRQTYLKRLLGQKPLSLDFGKDDLDEAEFIFWPSYEDGTEPDLVIIVGSYYLLFEAKYFTDFGVATETAKCQLERELEGGQFEAKDLQKEFIPIAITAHYSHSERILKGFPKFKWMNWQSISSLLLNLIENDQGNLKDRTFALDLYKLLDKKNLRGFLTFSRLTDRYQILQISSAIFFSAKTAKYRGAFIGFQGALSTTDRIPAISEVFFYKQKNYWSMPKNIGPNKERIFWEET